METNHKITIPKPCHEDWNQMTPDQTGRFCNSCAKSVVDFTNMKSSEIQDFFIKHQGQKICGRFMNEQLDSITIQIPREALFSQVHFHKIFLLALLVCMGTTLFSCQDNKGNSQNIDKVEIVDSTKQHMTAGMILPEKASSANTPKKDTVCISRFREGIPSTGEIAIEPVPVPVDTNAIYDASSVEVKPDFPGGIYKFYDYFKANFKVSEDVSGKMILTFIVDSNGKPTNIKVLRGINETLDKEVIRFLEDSTPWIPGEQNGEKVKVRYSLPIKINLN